MSFDLTFPLVMLAAYGLLNLLLSVGVAFIWRAGLRARVVRANAVMGVRLLPVLGSAVLVLTVVMPAFLLYEPRHAQDEPGPLLALSALFALLVLGDGVRRASRAWRATRALARDSQPIASGSAAGRAEVSVINVKEPLVAVVGGWRQRIVAARCVATTCDGEEFRQVLAHEAAHIDTRDNLKLLMQLALPDALAWLPAGAELAEHWRVATELEADERASGSDPHKRIALASALIKVARLAVASGRPRTMSRVSAHLGGLEHRVRRLLAPAVSASPGFPAMRLFTCVLLVPLAAMPLYAFIHRLIEVLVAFGR
jgi:Zn-dependent protease with chaperone function